MAATAPGRRTDDTNGAHDTDGKHGSHGGGAFEEFIPSSFAMAGFAMPENAHVPGRTPRPLLCSPVLSASRAAPPRVSPQEWQRNYCYIYGFALYGEGFFWEAHEVWEPVWMGLAPNSRERRLLEALIQTANACLKVRMARPRAVQRLAAMAREHFIDVARASGPMSGPKTIMGVNPHRGHDELVCFERCLAQNGEQAGRTETQNSILTERPRFEIR